MASSWSSEREIETALREALAGFGVAGMAQVHDGQAELFTGNTPVSVDLESLPQQWPLLPADIKQRRIAELARRLVAAQRAAGGPAIRRGTGIFSIPVAAVVLAGVGLFVGARWWSSSAAGGAAARPVVAETAEQKRARAWPGPARRHAAVCAPRIHGAVRHRGLDGELWVARARPGTPAHRPGRRALIQGDRLAAGVDEKLNAPPMARADRLGHAGGAAAPRRVDLG